MAKRLIDANSLIKNFEKLYQTCIYPYPGTTWRRGLDLAVELLLRSPTVDAVEIPCKIGDAVYVVYSPKYPANPSDKGKWFMREDGVQRILLGAKGWSIETWNMGTYPENKIGKTLFFNKEEAESALKERKEK